MQGELETLYSPNRFKRKADKELARKGIKEIWDPEERQKYLKGDRFVAVRQDLAEADGEFDNQCKPNASYLQLLDRQLNAFAPQRSGEPLLDRVDVVVKQLPQDASHAEFSAAVLEDMLESNGQLDNRHRVAVELGLLLRRLRIAAGVANPKEKKKERRGSIRSSGAGGGDDSAQKSKAPLDKDVDRETKKAKQPAAEGEQQELENPLTKYAKTIPELGHPGAARRLWIRIVSRMDELYTVAERLLNTFENAMRRIAHETGRDESEQTFLYNSVQISELKSPIRAHEKALDEYQHRFSDEVLPEACLTDIIRCRMDFNTGSQVIQVVQRLMNGVRFDDGDSSIAAAAAAAAATPAAQTRGARPQAAAPAAAVIQPLKECELTTMNMFNRYAELDPTHFRAHVLTLRLAYKGISVFCEVEVHYSEIMKVHCRGIESNMPHNAHASVIRAALQNLRARSQPNVSLALIAGRTL